MFKMASGSFPIFALSNHTTLSQTQTGATVPLTTLTKGLSYHRLKQHQISQTETVRLENETVTLHCGKNQQTKRYQ